jgi:hypothetical protein
MYATPAFLTRRHSKNLVVRVNRKDGVLHLTAKLHGMTPVVVKAWRVRQKLAIQVTHVG